MLAPPRPSQLFGNKFAAPEFPEPPRANFDSIVFSMITVFITVTGDGWNDVWVDVHRVSSGPVVPAYFVLLLVIANYMLLSLMVALLLGVALATARGFASCVCGMHNGTAVYRHELCFCPRGGRTRRALAGCK